MLESLLGPHVLMVFIDGRLVDPELYSADLTKFPIKLVFKPGVKLRYPIADGKIRVLSIPEAAWLESVQIGFERVSPREEDDKDEGD